MNWIAEGKELARADAAEPTWTSYKYRTTPEGKWIKTKPAGRGANPLLWGDWVLQKPVRKSAPGRSQGVKDPRVTFGPRGGRYYQ